MTLEIKFDNGATYERYMGKWSQLVGERFLDWIDAPNGLRWLDVGCGNGAFTERIVERLAPASVSGIDPSAEQLEFARARPALSRVDFRQGDAMALPWQDDQFDAAVMPLVIHFVPDPAKGVSEMARAVRTGGLVTAYVWDMEGGFPYTTLQREMRTCEMFVPAAPREDSSGLDTLAALWSTAGLASVETRVIEVSRTFENFDDYWSTVSVGPSTGRTLSQLAPERTVELQRRMRALLPTADDGSITYSARAHAVRGVVG